MSISYTKLFEILNQRKLNKYYLRKNGIHAAVVDKLIKDKNVDTTTISRICGLLQVQPGDIMEFVPDTKDGD